MKQIYLIILLTVGSGWPADAQEVPDRGFPVQRSYFQLFGATTFHRAAEVVTQGYAGMDFVPYVGMETGISLVIPVQLWSGGKRFHWVTDMLYGINPVSVNMDLNGEFFFVNVDEYDKIRFNDSYAAVRQSLFMYRRATSKRLTRMGIGFGVRAHIRNDFTLVYREPDGNKEVQVNFFTETPSGQGKWIGSADVQLIKGWQWLAGRGAYIGLDVIVNLTAGSRDEYRYEIFSPFNYMEGRIIPRTNYVGIRVSTALTGFGKVHINGDRFPD